ncbi:MAG: GIY-YIG nuclease family protein [Proteobacteria bacterium]|nr:GIY-YIG nuclease family protein [Pseudomonadota bacterium]
MTLPETLELLGPFSLASTGDDHDFFAWPFRSPSGVYIFTVPVAESYKAFYVGMSIDIKWRMREHIRSYLSGQYLLYEPAVICQGSLDPIYTPCEPEKFLGRAGELLPKALELLRLARIFVLEMPTDTRLLRRVESAPY